MAEKTYREFDPWRPAPVREVSREEVFSAHYFDIDRVTLSNKEVGIFTRNILRENDGDTIAVLPITANNEIILIEQYRVPNRMWTLEIPAGHATHNEKPLEVAAIKLRDEAGYEAENFSEVVRFINTPSFSTQHTAIYRATGLSLTERGVISPESPSSTARLIPLNDAYEMALGGIIVDAKSIIAILNEHTRQLSQKL